MCETNKNHLKNELELFKTKLHDKERALRLVKDESQNAGINALKAVKINKLQ